MHVIFISEKLMNASGNFYPKIFQLLQLFNEYSLNSAMPLPITSVFSGSFPNIPDTQCVDKSMQGLFLAFQ